MPKLPILNSRNLIKALKSIGFLEHRQKSTSHLVMKHQDGRRTVVPIHSNKDIPKEHYLPSLEIFKSPKKN